MKDWHGVTYHSIDEPQTRDAIATISDYLFQLSPGIAKIGLGLQPNSSGLPIVAEVDLSDFFKLSGPLARRTVTNIALGTSTVGSTGDPWQRFVYAGITKLDIVPILNNVGVVDLALNVNSGAVQFIDSTIATTGLRIAFSSDHSFIQAGRLDSGGTVLNKNLILGGMNAVCGSDISINFNTSNFDSSGTGADGVPRVGVNSAPTSRTGTGQGDQPLFTTLAAPSVNLKYSNALYVGSGTTTHDTVEFAKFGESPTGNRFIGITRNAHLNLYTSGGTFQSYITGDSAEGAFLIADSSLSYMLLQNTNSFTDGAGKGTVHVRLSDSNAAVGSVRWAAICSPRSGGTSQPFDRFALQSKLFMICDGILETTSSDFTVPTAMLHIKSALSNSTVLLNLRRKSGQTGDLTQWLDSNGTTVLAKFDKDAVLTVPGVIIGAGTTTLAPLTLTSGTSLTSAVAGSVEFTTDDLFFTITTGSARKRVALVDPSGGLTSGRVTFATTNGRLTDDSDMTFATDTLTVTKIVGSTSVKVGSVAGYISSDGSTGATGTFTTADAKTVTVKDGIITAIV